MSTTCIEGHSMLQRLVCLALFLTIAFLVDRSSSAVEQAENRPNFILFIADDMACEDCGPYGHPSIRTPNLDRLAAEGMRFDRAFLTCSSCSPSRASIITGRYPHNTGAHQLHLPLPAEQITFPEKLKQAGYWTAAAGKWHLGSAVKDRFHEVREGGTKFVEVLRDRPQDKPFFLWLAFSDPHRPYQQGALSPPHRPSDAVVPPYLPDVPEVRGDLAQYYDEIGRLDGVVGEVLAELDRQGLAETTMVLFISDNGRPFPRCKTTVYDSGIRTPWIVRHPQLVKAASVCQSLVSSIDIAPTILELAGVERPSSLQGVSIGPLLSDPSAATRQHIFAEHNWHDFDDHGRAVRDNQYKYIRNYYTDIPGTPPADAVRSPTYAVMQKMFAAAELNAAQRSCFVVPRPEEELYDLAADPHELHNLARDSAHAQALGRLRNELSAWQKTTTDQLPASRRPDEFDRQTGERIDRPRKRR
jgi:arylsulfatase A-like enzyme